MLVFLNDTTLTVQRKTLNNWLKSLKYSIKDKSKSQWD